MYPQAFTRWLYRGQRPHGLARLMNRTWATVSASGVVAKFGAVTLDVVGRTSGRTVSLPLVLVTVDGQRYLVSMLGDDVQWVKNVRAAGGRDPCRAARSHLAGVPAARARSAPSHAGEQGRAAR
jgi:hypothetical protein